MTAAYHPAESVVEGEDPMSRLRTLEASLRRNLFIWPADRIQAFLDKEVTSLDAAFGVIGKKPGIRPNSGTTKQDAYALIMLIDGTSIRGIARALGIQPSDVRRLKDLSILHPPNTSGMTKSQRQRVLRLHQRKIEALATIVADELAADSHQPSCRGDE